ncbi:hypothetical protein [Pseudomonas trivialis]|uniref:hypothetical protein n=1 Tax=Pseudomonas trivialis TaxID=200450 RepID=UPI000B0E529F|nr:hypothetical protein [Pseudomonas trivialis]
MSDPKVIYLGPACEAKTGDGRTWAEDWPWDDCECGHQPVQYVLGETFSRMKAERDALQQLLNQRDEQVESLKLRAQGEPVEYCETFEYQLEMLGAIDRCDVACGSYGDKFHRWDDAGPYVEYEDHVKHIELYMQEVERLSKLYAEQPAPVAVLPERLQQVLKFLDGAENLDGHWFGEPHSSGRPYWWRNELRKALTETNLFAKQL